MSKTFFGFGKVFKAKAERTLDPTLIKQPPALSKFMNTQYVSIRKLKQPQAKSTTALSATPQLELPSDKRVGCSFQAEFVAKFPSKFFDCAIPVYK